MLGIGSYLAPAGDQINAWIGDQVAADGYLALIALSVFATLITLALIVLVWRVATLPVVRRSVRDAVARFRGTDGRHARTVTVGGNPRFPRR